MRGKVDEKGKIVKDKEDVKKRTDVTKKIFKKWSKKNMVYLQKDGEQEDENLVKRAKDLFTKRRQG